MAGLSFVLNPPDGLTFRPVNSLRMAGRPIVPGAPTGLTFCPVNSLRMAGRPIVLGPPSGLTFCPVNSLRMSGRPTFVGSISGEILPAPLCNRLTRLSNLVVCPLGKVWWLCLVRRSTTLVLVLGTLCPRPLCVSIRLA